MWGINGPQCKPVVSSVSVLDCVFGTWCSVNVAPNSRDPASLQGPPGANGLRRRASAPSRVLALGDGFARGLRGRSPPPRGSAAGHQRPRPFLSARRRATRGGRPSGAGRACGAVGADVLRFAGRPLAGARRAVHRRLGLRVDHDRERRHVAVALLAHGAEDRAAGLDRDAVAGVERVAQAAARVGGQPGVQETR